MLQDTQSIRYYQRLTDDMVDLWHRGSRFDEIRLYVEGYLACLRDSSSIEPYLIHRLEEEIFRFLRDPSNFEYLSPQTQTQTEADYGYYWPQFGLREFGHQFRKKNRIDSRESPRD